MNEQKIMPEPDPTDEKASVPRWEPDEEAVLAYLLDVDHPDLAGLKAHRAFSDKWIVHFLRRPRPIPRTVIQSIFGDPAFKVSGRIRRALFRCLSTPPAIAMSLMRVLGWLDLVAALKDPHFPPSLKRLVEHRLSEIIPRLELGHKISLARQAPRGVVPLMRTLPQAEVISALLNNHFFTFDDAMFLANYPKTPASTLAELANSKRWNYFKDIKLSLLKHANTPANLIPKLLVGLSRHDFRRLLASPLSQANRNQVQRSMQQRFGRQTEETLGRRSES